MLTKPPRPSPNAMTEQPTIVYPTAHTPSLHSLTIASVNANCNHTITSSLLQCSHAHILLVQEPSWVTLVPGRSDSDPDGVPRHGLACHPDWIPFTPEGGELVSDRPHVVTWIRSYLVDSLCIDVLPAFRTNTSVGLTLHHDSFVLTVLNFYHHVIDHTPNLTPLLTLEPLDHPALLCGNFNTHHGDWSPPSCRHWDRAP